MAEDDEAARRSDPVDAYFAANMTRLREAAGISQAEMVHKLREQGWANVHPTTISRIEKGERPVRLSEATQIAAVLGQNLARMSAQPERAGIEEEVDTAIERVTKSFNRIVASVCWLTLDRNVLRTKLAEFRAVVDRENDDRLREKLSKSERFLALRVDNAVKAGREAYAPGGFGGSSFQDVVDRYGFNPDHAPEFVDEEDINAPTA